MAPSIRILLVMLVALGSSPRAAGDQTAACDSKIQAVEVNGATLHYFECGDGEPLVFVHGTVGDLHTFQRHVETFAKTFRVIAYSRRFAPPNAPPRAEDVNPLRAHVADLEALVRQLKASPAHFVGSSYGAYVSLALAVDHPELVRSLVLGEPPVLPLLSRTSVGDSVRQSSIRVLERSRTAFEAGSLENGLRSFLGPVGGTRFDSLPQSVRTELAEKQGPELRAQLRTGMSELMPSLDCGDLAKLKRPALLVTGERSPAMFLLITAELERCLENESQVMVPEAGHGMHDDNAAFYSQAVMAFLQRH